MIDKTRNSGQKHVYEINGAAFSSLEGFFDEVSRKLIPDAILGKNLDAFNDILRGGFGTPEDGLCCGGSIQMHLGNSSDSLRQCASCAVADVNVRRSMCCVQNCSSYCSTGENKPKIFTI